MKELFGKKATIEYPSLFAGPKEAQGFEYNDAGTQIRWQGQREFVAIGGLAVRSELSDDDQAAQRKAAAQAKEQKQADEITRLRAELAASKAQLANFAKPQFPQQQQQPPADLTDKTNPTDPAAPADTSAPIS